MLMQSNPQSEVAFAARLVDSLFLFYQVEWFHCATF